MVYEHHNNLLTTKLVEVNIKSKHQIIKDNNTKYHTKLYYFIKKPISE